MSDKRIESMLFDYGTTNRTDYRNGEIRPQSITVYNEKPRRAPPKLRPLKDVHTLSDWKAEAISFSLLHRPKQILGTDPRIVQQPCEKPKDTEREIAQRTRPRIVMTPAVSMDDIENPRARDILCNDMYTSDTSKGLREAVTSYFSVKAPLPGLPAAANPVALAKLQPPYVSPEWRMESVSWDGKQLRAHCDPSKEFWLERERSRCKPCDESARVREYRKYSKKL
ncbi:uncharacterized protein LOC101737450 isoform X1 [Bombyx mori]|uniref:Uncharacterized protein n=1 Tax=Bombyx mori TaxID=7091 RepID=A0A8R1WLX5_BOMMO|nr:uncharacterized protein LOC101737450 isoform X1 [Bombyx mori]